MIKIILKALSIFIVIQFVAYLFVAYVIWNPNPSTWTPDDRFMMAILGTIFGVGSVGGYITTKTL